MIDCDEEGSIDRHAAGDKAAALIELYRFARDCEFDVPRFRVLTADALDRFYERTQWAPRLAYPDLPAPDHVPVGVREGLLPFATFAAREIEQCVRGFDTALMLRSSLVLPEGCTVSACGCNTTRMADRVQVRALADGPRVPELLAQFYKAFTTWSLDPAAVWSRRRGAVVLMEAVPFRALGAACLSGDTLAVEADGKYPYARQRYVCDPHGVPRHPVRHEVLGSRDLKGLSRACWDLLRDRPLDGDLVEVEFGIGLDDRLHVVQERRFAGGAGRRPGAFHSIAAADGVLSDLRRAPRTRDSLYQAVRGGDRVLVLSREAPDRFDCFAFAWAHAAAGGGPVPVRGLLVQDTGPIAYGAGFRNHLTRGLTERYPGLFLGQLPGDRPAPGHHEASVPRPGERVRLSSDGALLKIEPEARVAVAVAEPADARVRSSGGQPS